MTSGLAWDGRIDLGPYLTSLPGDNDREFLRRVFQTPRIVYEERLRSIGFAGRGRVLDAGCGYGQWTLVMAELNQEVVGLESDAARICIGRGLATDLEQCNVEFEAGDLERMPFGDASFEAVFCFSAIFICDYRQVLREVRRVLKPGGLFYFNTNGLGWYLHNLIDGHNPADDFSPRQMAIDTLRDTLRFYATGRHERGSSIAMPSEVTLEEVRQAGFEVDAFGPDGSIGDPDCRNAFWPQTHYGEEGVYEVLCRVV